MNLITESWDRSSSEEREEFLRELHKRYRFERICLALSIVTDCEQKDRFWCKETERSF
ncbi:MAG TPA: hypothetical protein VEF37_00110 [Thermodesulfovibrionales bacterium]|nr:hypothetical protein [Thermodesulfovibrionales bacterium]